MAPFSPGSLYCPSPVILHSPQPVPWLNSLLHWPVHPTSPLSTLNTLSSQTCSASRVLSLSGQKHHRGASFPNHSPSPPASSAGSSWVPTPTPTPPPPSPPPSRVHLPSTPLLPYFKPNYCNSCPTGLHPRCPLPGNPLSWGCQSPDMEGHSCHSSAPNSSMAPQAKTKSWLSAGHVRPLPNSWSPYTKWLVVPQTWEAFSCLFTSLSLGGASLPHLFSRWTLSVPSEVS